MGLNEGANVTYLGISDGRISLRVNEDTPGAVQIVNRETGNVTWIKYYKSVSGYLVGLENKQDRFNEKSYNWHLTISDGDGTYVLQVRESSGYGRSLMKSLPNVDFTKKITFSPYVKTVDDKKRGTLYLSQDGNNVEWFFTRENPNGLPELVQRADARGNITYDDSAILDFFVKYVDQVIRPRIAEASRGRLADIPTGDPITETDDSQAWMDAEHARQTEDIRATKEAEAKNNAQAGTFSDGSPVPNELPWK